MHYSRLSFVVSAMLVTASSAFAASEVNVQFGSFETREEADKRLSEVKSAHVAEVKSLSPQVREVKLPPDNLSVFRTQAGPLPSRAAAQALCDKFSNSGDECYVVETAVSSTPKAAEVAPLEKPAKTVDAKADVKPAVADKAAAKPAKPVAEKPAATEAVATTPAEPAISVATSSTTLIPAPTVAEAAPTLSVPMAPAASDTAMLAANNADKQGALLTPPSFSSTAPSAENAAVPSLQIQSAMDQAVLDQNAAEAKAALPVVKPAPAKPSFWARLNPFAAPASAEDAAKFPPVASSIPAKEVAAAAPILVSTPAPAVEAVAAPVVVEQPKPAPKAVVVKTPEAPVPASVAFPVAAPAADAGTVRVEEAKRVPLSESISSTNNLVPTQVPNVALMPSSTLGVKTLWAQIGQFSSMQDALVFWNGYRRMHPDFPTVRVRVSSPLLQQQRGDDHVWLRVGPFARSGSISNLCTSLAENEKVTCGRVTDLGIAGSVTGSGDRLLAPSRYRR